MCTLFTSVRCSMRLWAVDRFSFNVSTSTSVISFGWTTMDMYIGTYQHNASSLINMYKYDLEVKAFSLKFCLYHLSTSNWHYPQKPPKYIENKLLNRFFKVTFKFFVLWDLNAWVCSYNQVEPHGSKAVYLNPLALRTAVCPGVVGRAWSLPKTQIHKSHLYVNSSIIKIL